MNAQHTMQPAAPVYKMLYRPATQFGTLPPGVHIARWVRVPRDLAARFPHLPVSDHAFGEFVTSRALTDAELRDYQIERVR